MLMPYSPLDALINALPAVRKAGRVKPGDTVLSVHQRIADVLTPIVERIREEQREQDCKAVCPFCRDGDTPVRLQTLGKMQWIHSPNTAWSTWCRATPIRERGKSA